MLKKTILLVFTLFFAYSIKCQSNEGQRYLAALSYIYTSSDVKKEIKKTFPKLFKCKKRCPQFTIDSLVQPIPLYFFDDIVSPGRIGLSNDFIENDQKFNKEYGFESYVSKDLLVVSKSEKPKMVLIFSKPINNFLLAEILDKRLFIGRFKQGPALKMLFLFDEKGVVSEVFFHKTLYN